MSIHNLDGIFHPKSVAVIGANERKDSVGSAIIRNLTEGGFKGGIHPVNPAYQSVWGFPFAASVLDLDAPPDLAVIATPIDTSPASTPPSPIGCRCPARPPLFPTAAPLKDIIQDLALALPPLNRLLARRLMEATRIYGH